MAILFALVFTFMFVLFAFVVDFGHLIHNKMNLQIAADAAAYAGAAWQARLLNQMGIVNYHMRQDHKELTMRVNVTHARHNRTFPSGRAYIDGPDSVPTGSATMVCQQAYSYRALRGRQYSFDTNLCRNADPANGGLPPIVVPPAIATFDPAVIAIRAQIRSIQGEAAKECNQAREDNIILIRHLIEVFKQRSDQHLAQIAGLRDFMNQVSQESSSGSSQHPIVQAAYQSALRNLTDSNRNGEFKLDILQPQGDKYVDTEIIKANTNLWYFEFQNGAGGSCVAYPDHIIFNPVLGVQKDPQYLTYFGVKVSSKPQMLFMPQSWIDAAFPKLEAYAIAKPFGSRLGPNRNTSNYLNIENAQSAVDRNTYLNFSVRPFDNIGGGRNTKLLAYFDSLHPFQNGDQTVSWPDPRGNLPRAPLQAIRTPNIFDALFFTVFPNPGANIERDYLEPEYASALFPDYVEVAGPDNVPINRTPASPPYLRALTGSRNGQGWIADKAGTQPLPNYGLYAAEEASSHSVMGSAFLPGGIANRATEFGFATPDMIHSAWSPGPVGRIGYGVKYISLEDLSQVLKIQTPNRQDVEIKNKPVSDTNTNYILH